jgi:hypothetical protein
MAITDINISGKVRSDDGGAVPDASVYYRQTAAALTGTALTGLATAASTTDANGTFTATLTTLTHTYDVEIDKGSKRFIPWSDEIALKTVDTSVMKVRGVDGADAPIYLFADRADQNIDVWRINAADGGILTFDNRASGSSDSDLVAQLTITPHATATSSVVTVAGELDAVTLDISGNADIAGTTNLDAVDIDGAVQIDATFTSGVDGQGYDTKFFGDTASAYILWDTSADKLLTAGGAVVDIVKDKLLIGGTAVTTTAAELNLLDNVSGLVQADLTKLAAVDSTAGELNLLDGSEKSTSSITIVDADAFVVIDGTTTKQIPASDLKTYAGGAVTAINNATANELVTIGSTTTELDAEANLTFDGSDLTLANNVGIVFGDAGEKIEGDGTDMQITANKLNVAVAGAAGGLQLGGTVIGYGGPLLTVFKPSYSDTAISCGRPDNGPVIRFSNGDDFHLSGNERGTIAVDGSSTAYNTSSDYRLKENETAISDGLTRVKALKPYRFNFKADTGTTRDGFFAHEAATVVPESVTGAKDATRDGDPVYQGMDHSKLVPILVAALKEIDARVTALE